MDIKQATRYLAGAHVAKAPFISDRDLKRLEKELGSTVKSKLQGARRSRVFTTLVGGEKALVIELQFDDWLSFDEKWFITYVVKPVVSPYGLDVEDLKVTHMRQGIVLEKWYYFPLN